MLFGARLGSFADGETTLAHDGADGAPARHAVPGRPAVLRSRALAGGRATGADLLWRVKRNLRLPRETVLADGSFLSTIYPGEKDRRHKAAGVRVRVVEYRLEGVADAAARSTGW